MLSSYKYYCPKCSYNLNLGLLVGFNVVENGEFVTLIKLNPKSGEYDYESDPVTKFDEGKLLDLCCPSCNENLQSSQFKQFASTIVRPSEKINFEVLFERSAGQHTTYVMTEDMIGKKGEHPKDLI